MGEICTDDQKENQQSNINSCKSINAHNAAVIIIDLSLCCVVFVLIVMDAVVN